MKKIAPLFIATSLFLSIQSIAYAESGRTDVTYQENVIANPYDIKIYDFTDKNKSLYFSTSNPDGNFGGISAVINGKKYTDIFDFVKSNVKEELYFGKKFPAGTKIDIYANFLEYGTLDEKEVFLKTIVVQDKTAPKITLGDFSIRSTSLAISTNEAATVTATYNGQKIAVKKISNTKWKATFKKPLKNKKLVVTAKDTTGNASTASATSTVPSDIAVIGDYIQVGDKYVSGLTSNANKTDKVYLKMGGKTYKGNVKNNKFTIKLPSNIPSPKKIKFYLKDKFGNTLDVDNFRKTYKYIEPKVGMTKAQVLNTIQGAPDSKSSDTYGKDRYDYWCYDFYDYTEYVNFYNGKVMSISRYDN